MKKWLLIALVVICIPITLIGCVPTAAPATQTPVVSPITELQNWKGGIDSWKTTTADPAIAKINAQQATTNYQSQIDSIKATMTAQDGKITDLTTQLTDLKNKYTALTTASTTTTTSTIGTSGNIPQFTPGVLTTPILTTTNGQIEQQVNYSSQGNLIYAGTGGSNQFYYTQRFINHNSVSQMFVTPKIGLSLGSGSGYAYSPQTVTNITFNISGGSGGFYSGAPVTANYSTNSTANFQINGSSGIAYYLMNPPLGTSAYSLSITPYYTYYKGLPVGPGQYMEVNVQIYGLYCSPGATWTVTPSFDQSL